MKIIRVLTLATIAILLLNTSVKAQGTPTPTVSEPTQPKPSWMNYTNSYTNSGSLGTAHITDTEVVNWAQNAVSDMFALSPENYAEKLKLFKTNYFAKSGWMKYAQFMKDSSTLEMITNKSYSVAAIVRHDPAIINAKDVDGKYHWVFKMDTSISFSVVTSKGETRTVKTGNYILYMDIQRTDENKNEFKIEISDIRLDPDMSGGGY